MKVGWSFTFRVADALELHRPDGGNKEYPSISKTIQRLERVSDSVRLRRKGMEELELSAKTKESK